MFQINISSNEDRIDHNSSNNVDKDIQNFIKDLNEKYSNIDVSVVDTKKDALEIHHTENGHYVCIHTRNIGGKLLFTTLGDSNKDSVIIGGVEINMNGDLKVFNSTIVNNKREMTHRIYPDIPHKIN